jgi:hypothetical protein
MNSGIREGTVDMLRNLRDLDPMVGPIELCCRWFEDLYHPSESAWQAAFSVEERQLLQTFHETFSKASDFLPEDVGTFQSDPGWQAVSRAAELVLRRMVQHAV